MRSIDAEDRRVELAVDGVRRDHAHETKIGGQQQEQESAHERADEQLFSQRRQSCSREETKWHEK